MSAKRKNGPGKKPQGNRAQQKMKSEEEIRLNKYIAHAGLCSRREADALISKGKVLVNGKVITEMGFKVKKTDEVVADGQNLSLEPFVYLLLNKKKNTITTTDDEKGRRTVMDSISEATGLRVYPVGRLDRNTTGLLLLTNDGDLAHRLMHPSYQIKKSYQVTTDRPLSDEQLGSFKAGIELEDGVARAFGLKRHPTKPNTFELSVHEGRNHLIRRMVSYHGAEVTKLKRVNYAGFTLKDLSPGRWRFLKQNEVNTMRELVKLDALDFNKE